MYPTLCAIFAIYLIFYICKKEFFSSHETMKNNEKSSVKYNVEELSSAFNVGLKSLEESLKTKRLSIIKMYNVIATHSIFKFTFQVYNFETTNISIWNLEIQRPALKKGAYKTLVLEKNVKPDLSEQQLKFESMASKTLEKNASYFHY